MSAIRARFAVLWTVTMFNYLYCDLVGLMDTEQLRQFVDGRVGDIEITQTFLLGAAVLMEIPIAMIAVSWLAPARVVRWANVAAGVVMTLVQVATLAMDAPTPYYAFFSAFEIAATVTIAALAWRWRGERGADATSVSPAAAL